MDQSDCYYDDILDGLSDAHSNDSSDEDVDVQMLVKCGKFLSTKDKEILLGANTNQEGEDGDEHEEEEEEEMSFEQEMHKEVSNHINGVHCEPTQPAHSEKNVADTNNIPAGEPSISRMREQEYDELLYDPDEDNSNERWIESVRSKSLRLNTRCVGQTIDQSRQRQQPYLANKPPKLAHSDATLNCPCCMALLCLDCQRHELYKTQYRAMFVSNCRIDYQNKLIHKDKQERRNQFRRSQRAKATTDAEKEDSGDGLVERVYHPVHCGQCNTQVAVYDHDQVYHFFSVLASH